VKKLILFSTLLFVLVFTSVAAQCQQLTIQTDSGKQVVLNRADLEALPHVKVTASEHSSGSVSVEGLKRCGDVSIDWQLDEHLPTVSVDLTQIQQAFINLISNAMEALEGSQISPHIIVRASATDQDQMLIQVIDNGPGVADQEGIFDAFVTTKTNGMGIGLAVSRSIVEAHGGRLWAENNAAGGATFNVALPVSPFVQTFNVS
jgi:signal transduction histidine kinase